MTWTRIPADAFAETLADAEVSVSPLRVPGRTANTDAVAALLSGFGTE